MYSRDPFNLRKTPPSALTYLQSAASHASTVAQKATEKAAEAVSETVQAATDKVKDADMSFKLPSNIPNFDNAQRRFEDNVWNKFSGNDKELPMYKDKPTYGARRGGGWFSGRRRVGVIALVVLGALYWLGWSNRGDAGEKVETGKKGSWIPGAQTGKKNVDWDTRRESVKNAFLLSWKGYEEHGWGRSRTNCNWAGAQLRLIEGPQANICRIRRVPSRCEKWTIHGPAERHGLDNCGCIGYIDGHEPHERAETCTRMGIDHAEL